MARKITLNDVKGNDNAIQIEFLGDSFEFLSEDTETDTLLPITISRDDAERLVKHLIKNLQK